MNDLGIIYILKNKINNKIYIGQTTKEFKTRLNNHYHGKSVIGNALRKYDINDFDNIIFTHIPIMLLDYMEISLIKRLNSLRPNGYNLETGGNKNKTYTKERKDKISKSLKGRPSPMRGRTLSEEHKKRIGLAEKGEKNCWYGKKRPPFSVETRIKMSSSHIGKKRKPFTKEHLKNMSLTQMGHKNNVGRILSEVTKTKISRSLIRYYINKKGN